MEDSSEDSEEGCGKNPNPPGAPLSRAVFLSVIWVRSSADPSSSHNPRAEIFALKKCVGAGAGRERERERERRGDLFRVASFGFGPSPAPAPAAAAASRFHEHSCRLCRLLRRCPLSSSFTVLRNSIIPPCSKSAAKAKRRTAAGQRRGPTDGQSSAGESSVGRGTRFQFSEVATVGMRSAPTSTKEKKETWPNNLAV